MENFIVTVLAVLAMAVTEPTIENTQAIVDRIEGDYAVVEFSTGEESKMLDFLVEDINGTVIEGTKLGVKSAKGKFHGSFLASNKDGVKDRYYQFKSDDDSVWWCLSAKELGFTPDTNSKYEIYFSENSTTKFNPPCDCPEEYDCECYLYDDLFFHIEQINAT